MSAQKRLSSIVLLSSYLCLSGCQRTDQLKSIGIQKAGRIEALVLAKRKPPLIDFAVQRKLSIVDYGAAPNDGKNALPALSKAIQEIQKEGKPTELSFPQGRYIISSAQPEAGYCFQIDQIHDLIINGNNSEIILKNPDRGFLRILHGQNIIVNDLAVDYDPLPFSQGYVQKVDQAQGSFDFAIAEGFPLLYAAH